VTGGLVGPFDGDRFRFSRTIGRKNIELTIRSVRREPETTANTLFDLRLPLIFICTSLTIFFNDLIQEDSQIRSY
jgi:hypothetical protein